MDIMKRLLRRPAATALWLAMVILMTVFLTVGTALYYSSSGLAKEMDRNHTAIAVRPEAVPTIIEAEPGRVVYSLPERKFTETDADWFRGLDSVKAVRSHTFSNATSEAFAPIIGLDKYTGWSTKADSEPYCDAVLVGRVVGLSAAGGLLEIGVEYEEAILLNPEFEEAEKVLKYTKNLSVTGRYPFDWNREDPDAEYSALREFREYFVVGESYVFCGRYLPSNKLELGRVYFKDGVLIGYGVDESALTLAVEQWYGDVPEDHEDSYWYSHPDETPQPYTPPDPETKPREEDYYISSRPAAEKLDCEPSAFIDSEGRDIWREYREKWEEQQHLLTVIGTDRLETFYVFLTGDAVIIDGRSFTEEEYANGGKAIILSEAMAQRTGLSVGDTVVLKQDTAEVPPFDPHAEGIDPFPDKSYGEEEQFTLVGIYRLQADWGSSVFDINPNVVFIPRSAQRPGAIGELETETGEADAQYSDVCGMNLSIELVNGAVDDFLLELERSPYTGQFYTFDQGLEAAQRDLNGLASSSFKMTLLACAGWALLLAVFLLLYQNAQRRNMGVMRSLGASPRRTGGYLFASGLIVAAAGVAIGTVISGIVLNVVQSRILDEVLSSVDRTAYGGALVISEERIAEMAASCSPKAWQLAAFAAAQLAAIAAVLGIQARSLAEKLPRKLLD